MAKPACAICFAACGRASVAALGRHGQTSFSSSATITAAEHDGYTVRTAGGGKGYRNFLRGRLQRTIAEMNEFVHIPVPAMIDFIQSEA